MCTVEVIDETTIKLHHNELYKSVTPGQIACFYDGDLCIGGGIIDKVYKNGEELIYFQ
jgi:tRNA-specific 2-thiouridylase